jgi:hypothetical protein
LELLKANGDETALKYIRPVIGAAEMLQNKSRFCLWLVDAEPKEILASTFISERVAMVKKLRSESKRAATVKLASTPYLFQEVREQKGDYLAVPIVSSSSREYVPMKVFSKDVIPTNALLTIPDIQLDQFAILESKLFSLWLKTVGGRLKSDYRISAEIVYNNFPFSDTNADQQQALASSSQEILSARSEYPMSSLAELYNPKAMPTSLRKAHDKNDQLVLATYGLKRSDSDATIITRLFELFSAKI